MTKPFKTDRNNTAFFAERLRLLREALDAGDIEVDYFRKAHRRLAGLIDNVGLVDDVLTYMERAADAAVYAARLESIDPKEDSK